MKKIISLLLIIIMLSSLVACDIIGNIAPDNGTNPDDEGFDLIIGDDEEDTDSEDQGNTDGTDPGQEEKPETPDNTDKPDPTPDPTPDIDPNPNTVTVYLINRAEWDQVAIYCWTWPAGYETPGGWPGVRLQVGEDGLYRAVIDSKYAQLIFNDNNRGQQTSDLNVPTGDRIVYDNLDKSWITYSEAVSLLDGDNGDDTHEHFFVNGKCECGETNSDYVPEIPHEHFFVNGECECGETDPNYVPEVPHEHFFVNGECECGETDPNYVPEVPHEHIFVNGKCECGETDPNYVPEVPHEHIFVNGKCECGETDPNYVPEVPHEHIFVNGKCECGETDPNYNPQPEIDPEMALFNDLFDHNNHVSLKLDISNSELKKIQKDYEKYSSMGSKSPIYRMANLIVTITKPDGTKNEYVIEQVGVRMKGNTSRTSFYSDSSGMYNLVHFKISFQETFDDATYYGSDALTWSDSNARKERKNRTFATLEKIDLRWNKNDDTTYIRESYAYDLYREFGVLAPHTNLTSVDVGNDHAGVWLMYEPIDKIFLEKNLPEEALGGDLYKLGWTSEGATFTSFSSYGVEDEDACKFYVYDLKTNKKTSTHESLKNFINTIKSSSATKASIENILDIENFMYYCAVSYMIGNPDDLRNNYNNSYIYFRADTGKMIVIPYDMDRGFGVNKDWNPSGNHMTKDDPFSTKAIGNNNSDQRSPLFLKTVCNGGFFKAEYTKALKAVDASEMLTISKFTEAFNIASALYSGNAKTSNTYNNASGHKFRFDLTRTCGLGDSSNYSFQNYLTAKRATLYKYIGDQGNTDNGGGDSGGSGGNNSGSGSGTNAKPYIMGDMSNWQTNSQYAMKSNGDGTFTFTVTTAHVSQNYNRIKFKIYDDSNGMWYGYEIVDPNCTVNCNDITNNANGNKNIYLAPGTYLLTFDANTVTLYVEKIG